MKGEWMQTIELKRETRCASRRSNPAQNTGRTNIIQTRPGRARLLILFIALGTALIRSPGLCRERTAADSATSASDAQVFSLHEDLTYEVSWMNIPLGSIRSVVTHQQGEGERKIVTVVAYINSYSGVPFINLEEIDETTMDQAALPSSFHAREKVDDQWKFTDYTFDQKQRLAIMKVSFADSETGNGKVVKKIDTLHTGPNCVDGLSLLFYARVNARRLTQSSVPTVISGRQGTTYLNFYRKETSAEIDAVDYPVDVIEFDGEAKFSGILGMSGPFTGWFSNDHAQIPIKAKLKIILGSITVELVKWNRAGWNPPRYRSKQ